MPVGQRATDPLGNRSKDVTSPAHSDRAGYAVWELDLSYAPGRQDPQKLADSDGGSRLKTGDCGAKSVFVSWHG